MYVVCYYVELIPNVHKSQNFENVLNCQWNNSIDLSTKIFSHNFKSICKVTSNIYRMLITVDFC